MNVVTILNTIRANSSSLYQERVPQATQDNLSDIGTVILNYEALQNEFIGALVNKIAFTVVSNRRFKNPLAQLKKGGVPFGSGWEETHINPAKDKGKSTKESEVSDLIGTEESDVATIYHSMNRQGKYKVSVSYEKLQTAFKGVGEMTSFIQGVIDSMYSGDEIDEFLLMKNTLSSAIENDSMVTIEVEYDGKEESAKELIKAIKTVSHNFTEPSTAFNGYNLKMKAQIEAGTKKARITWTPKENQVILVRADVDSSTDVEVLAKSFHMDKADFMKRKFVVGSFGDEDTIAVLTDDKLFQWRDNVYTVRTFPNGNSLVDNYMLHHYQTLSLSLFANCVAFKTKTV